MRMSVFYILKKYVFLRVHHRYSLSFFFNLNFQKLNLVKISNVIFVIAFYMSNSCRWFKNHGFETCSNFLCLELIFIQRHYLPFFHDHNYILLWYILFLCVCVSVYRDNFKRVLMFVIVIKKKM